MNDHLSQIVQIIGALGILVAFVASQSRMMDIRSAMYLWLNIAGATALALDAAYERQWGFFLLEGTWTAVSAFALVKR